MHLFSEKDVFQYSDGVDQGEERELYCAGVCCATAELRWRIGLVVNYFRDNKLLAVEILPKRHAELENKSAFASSITITQMIKGEAK